MHFYGIDSALPKRRQALGPLETPVRGQETSAGGLREVAQGEVASWDMKRGTRRGDVKFAPGSFSAVGLVRSRTWSHILDDFAVKEKEKARSEGNTSRFRGLSASRSEARAPAVLKANARIASIDLCIAFKKLSAGPVCKSSR